MADIKKLSTVAYVDECFRKTSRLSSVRSRILIGDGELVKMCRKGPMIRQFFLFNDLLVYGNIVVTNKRYDKQRIIPLEQVVIERLGDDRALNNGWLLKTKKKSFAVFASSETEKDCWVKYIERCIRELTTRGSFIPHIVHAPVWIPDKDEQECMLCHQNKFSAIQRRHHCRKCGIVVCSDCSSKRLELKSSNVPVRVCDHCYNEHKCVQWGMTVTSIENVAERSRTDSGKNIITKSTSSESAAAFAASRPWTATFYPAAQGYFSDQQATATLAQMVYDRLNSRENQRKDSAQRLATSFGKVHALAQAGCENLLIMPTLTADEKTEFSKLMAKMELTLAKINSNLATQIKELKKKITSEKGNAEKITANDLLNHSEEVTEISESFGSQFLVVHGVQMVHHFISVLTVMLIDDHQNQKSE